MPELPEMETYRRLLTDKVRGETITGVEINREKCINLASEQFREQISGQQVTEVARRAKHLLFRLGSGKLLLVHLMLGGWMYYASEKDTPDHQAQVVLVFGDERLYFFGLRFGYIHLLTEAEAMERLADLGPEPLSADFTEAGFRDAIANKRGVLKNTLVDQHFLAGIGTRYSDEICFRARQLPLKQCTDLTDEDIDVLYRAIPDTLRDAVNHGGYMSRPLYKGDTLTGGFAKHLKVYNREGKPCIRCGQSIMKDKLSSRKVFYCANCQG